MIIVDDDVSEEDSATFWCRVLCETSLATLVVRCVTLDLDDVKGLVHVLRVKPSLRSLSIAYIDIDDDSVTDADMDILWEAIESNPNLVRLYICHCPRLPRLPARIARLMRVNRHLKHLHVQGNNLGPTDCEEVANALKVNMSLVALNVSLNRMRGGVVHFGHALAVNNVLQHLYIADNLCNCKDMKSCVAAAQGNKSLVRADMGTFGRICARNRIRAILGIHNKPRTICETVIGDEVQYLRCPTYDNDMLHLLASFIGDPK